MKMKKMKALLLTLALGFTFAAAATVVGCNKGNGGAPTSSSDIFGDEEVSAAKLRFDTPFIETYQYEVFALQYKVEGTTSQVEFSTSDPAIATVDANGVVTTKDGIGKAVITAAVDGISATCEINVSKTPYAPQIVLNETSYTIEKGETLEFTVATQWNKVELSEGVEYAVSFAESSLNATAEIAVEGDVVKVVAVDVETVDVIISATVRGIYTSEMVTINVVNSPLRIQTQSAAFKPESGKYTANVSTTDLIGDLENSIALDFAVIKDGQAIDGASIAWEVEGDAVTIKEGSLVGQRVGTAKLTGEVEYEGETATVQIDCSVIAPTVHLDQTAVIEVENLETLRLETSLLEGDELIDAQLHDKKVSARAIGKMISFSKDSFPKKAAELGKQTLVINSKLVRYTMDVEIYTMVINDAAELDMMRDLADLKMTEYNIKEQKEVSSEYYDGYFVLGNDIDYNKTIKSMTDTGRVWCCQGTTYDLSRGFQGVFDGRGYNIDGLTIGDSHPSNDKNQSGGLFGYISKAGIVRNVSFTNATVYANNGLICSVGDGTIENVSVSFKKLGGDKETSGINSNNPRIMGAFFTMRAGTNATVRNCLIDASGADITDEQGSYGGQTIIPIKLAGVAKNVENVIVVCPDQKLLDQSGADIYRLTYADIQAESGLLTNFDKSIWTTVENIPMFVNQAERLDRDQPIEFLNVNDSLVTGFEMIVRTNNPYVKIELVEEEGVKFENSVLTATDVAFTKTVTLIATSLLNNEITATHRVYIDSFGKVAETTPTTGEVVIYNSNPVLSIGDNSWKGEENYVYLGADIIGSSIGEEDLVIDWNGNLEWGSNAVTIVTVNNSERTNFSATIKLDFVRKDFKDAEKVLDSVFSTWRTNVYTLTEIEDVSVEAPENYKSVMGLRCDEAWPTALGDSFFDATLNTAEYSDIWFGIRIINGRWVFQTVTLESNLWIQFHFVQVEDGVWAAEVFHDGNLYKTEYDINENSLRRMLYRNGWVNGFLLYNNNAGEISAESPTDVYSTEVYAIKKA